MRSVKVWPWFAIGFASLGFIAWVFYKSQSSGIIPGPTVADWWAVVKARDIHTRASDVASAMNGCEQWINTHSKPGVKKVVSRYERTDAPVKIKREYWVALDYREKTRGPLAQVTCHYVGVAGRVLLLEARTVYKY
jgi:hypothetical protein